MKSKLISTGNDIVALDRINIQRTLQKRFYSRILSADEILLFDEIDLRISFESFIWLCWSIKESVFKFIKRHHHEAVFSPTKIIVTAIREPLQQAEINVNTQEGISFQDAECFCCEVLYDGQNYYTRSLISSHFIFTVANDNDCFENTFWGIQTIESDSYTSQMQQVRTFVLERLQQQFRSEQLQIEKALVEFPFIVQHKHIPLSFAHHGTVVSYSFILENDCPPVVALCDAVPSLRGTKQPMLYNKCCL